jgi:hypothetical protein
MLPPMMGYEAGRGREMELERKIAERRQVVEAVASQRLKQPSLLEKLVSSLKRMAAQRDQRPVSRPGVKANRQQQPQATRGL